MSIEPDAEMVSSVAVTPAELDDFVAVYRAACGKRSRLRRACSGAPGAVSARRGRSARRIPVRCSISRSSRCRRRDAVRARRTRTCRRSPTAWTSSTRSRTSARRCTIRLSARSRMATSCLATRFRPAAPSAIGATRHAAIGALDRLGLSRDDVLAETMRSPKQVELRAKARGLKVPTELIVSRRSGVSLVRSENARAPVPGRGEIARSFSAALEAFQEGGNHDQAQLQHDHDDHDDDHANDNEREGTGYCPRTNGRRARLADGARGRRSIPSTRRPSPAVQGCRCCSSSATATARGRSGRSGPSSSTAAAGPSIRLTFKWGYICFSDGNKVVGERLVPVSQPMPDVAELPDKGFPWTEQWSVNLKCLDGADAGTRGGLQADDRRRHSGRRRQ